MIRLITCMGVCISLFCGQFALAGVFTDIYYSVEDLGLGRWEYTYDVDNISLTAGIEEFTIWFDYGLYDNLIVTTPDTPLEWDQIVWQVEPLLEEPGGYDALVENLGISVGETFSGFSVSFDWLSTGDPGSQFYEIIDPATFNSVDSGWTATVPEPATVLSIGAIAPFVLGSRKKHKEKHTA